MRAAPQSVQQEFSGMIPLGRSVSPGTSAIVAVIVHTWVAELKKQMQEAGADVMADQRRHRRCSPDFNNSRRRNAYA
jgi:hypothetical protein